MLEKIPYRHFIFYKLATFIPAFVGTYAIFHYSESIGWVIGYFALFLVHVSIIFRLKCTHCSYYKAPGKHLNCMWLWGIPKIFKANPKPESGFNKFYVPTGMAVVTLYPVYWLFNSWVLLIIYFSSIAVLVSSLFLFTCSKCTYFECSHNQVPKEIKEKY